MQYLDLMADNIICVDLTFLFFRISFLKMINKIVYNMMDVLKNLMLTCSYVFCPLLHGEWYHSPESATLCCDQATQSY